MACVSEMKKRIADILGNDMFEVILEKRVTDSSGRVYVPKEYVNNEVIIIVLNDSSEKT